MSYLGILTASLNPSSTASTTGGPTAPPTVSTAGGPIGVKPHPNIIHVNYHWVGNFQPIKYNKFLIKRIFVATSGKSMYYFG